MGRKKFDIWWSMLLISIAIFEISVVGAAIAYETSSDFNSSPIFILSIVGVIAGFTLYSYYFFTAGKDIKYLVSGIKNTSGK